MAKETRPSDKDPIVTRSFSWPLAIASVLLVISTVWALYDEVYTRRPWKDYQERFVKTYSRHLEALQRVQAKREKQIRTSIKFKELEKQLAVAEKAVARRITEIDHQLNSLINPRIAAITGTLQTARSNVTVLIYQIDVATSAAKKDTLQRQLDKVKKGPFEVRLVGDQADEEKTFDYDGLAKEYDKLKVHKVELFQERAELIRPASEIRARRDELLKRQLGGLSEKQVEGLARKMENFEYRIKQIHVNDIDLVDRCETCHLGIREPTVLTAETMGGQRVFTSHPNPELLETHDPQRFGCTPCHGGNGVATRSVDKAHGRYRHWPWPMHDRANTEAGCLQCHEGALELGSAEILNRGKEMFRHLGCWACHPRKGFDTERSQLQDIGQQIRLIAARRADYKKAIDDAQAIADDYDSSDEDVLEALERKQVLILKFSELETEKQQLSLRQRSLFMERKDVAPNLKDVRAKLRPQWLAVWLKDPKKFRPTTRMPQFRMPDDHIEAIAAFIWQAGVEPNTSPQPKGDASVGKELFDTRGCLGCHSVGETDDGLRYGGSFSVDLSRIAEKINYDYLVRWIHNPRERTLPFCQVCGRDINAKDYEAAGLPFKFDVDHSHCPVCDSQMQVQNQTVMPSFRLSFQEAADIASYLMTEKHPPAVYPSAHYINRPDLFEKGKKLAIHYGCMGCHEIAGTEKFGKTATELTKEGSKPIERLDFALLTHDAKKEGWYTHKGFLTRKLADPAIFDYGKEREPLEKLRMPDFGLTQKQNEALTTFLLGSVEAPFPMRYYHNPLGFDKDVRDGWWVLKKYNCIGCHQIVPETRPAILDLPQYEDENDVLAPPSLVGEGARVNPEWLVRFLRDPALGITHREGNGVRPYLDIRMPTFTLSEGEISKLVRFFNALSKQPSPYLKPPTERLSDEELLMARDAFRAAECIKCHAGGDSSSFTEETIAPTFVISNDRLKSRWMQRWLLDPALLMPGTRMPTGLFERQADRWIMRGAVPESMSGYQGDHIELFVRYMQQFTKEEASHLTSEKE